MNGLTIMRFSVVIPLYNKGSFIKRALDSVLAQITAAFEIIVVNDGSTDNGVAVVESFDDPRIVLLHQENAGVSSARNQGIEASQGDYVAFLDADDEWHLGFLEEIHQLIEAYPDAGLYATSYEIVTEQGHRKKAKIAYILDHPWRGYIPSYFKAAAFGRAPVCASAVCIPRQILNRSGLFQIGKRMGEDLDMWGRIAMHYKIAYSTEIFATYYMNVQDRACARPFDIADENPLVDMIKSNLSLPEIPPEISANMRIYLDKILIEDARHHVLNGNYLRARELCKSCGTKNFEFRKFIWGSPINKITHILWRLKYEIL